MDPSLPPAPEEEGPEMEAQGWVEKINKSSARHSQTRFTQIYLSFSPSALSFTLSHAPLSFLNNLGLHIEWPFGICHRVS